MFASCTEPMTTLTMCFRTLALLSLAAAVACAPNAPPEGAARRAMLDFYLLEKCIYEIGYELNNRPDWLPIPLEGLAGLLGETGEGGAP